MVDRLGPRALLVLALSGCSTAGYTNSVSEFADGSATVRATFDSLVSQEKDAVITTQTFLALNSGKMIVVPAACGVPEGDPQLTDLAKVDCAPYWIDKARVEEPVKIVAEAPNAVSLAAAVDEYAKALVNLAEAKDVADVKDAANKAAAAIATLASMAGPMGAGASAGVNFASWLYGKYLDELRLAQLRMVVEQADPVIAKASDLLAYDANLLVHSLVARRSQVVIQESIGLAAEERRYATEGGVAQAKDEVPLSTKIAAFVSDAMQLQQMARTNTTTAFKTMRTAHETLKTSLENSEVSITDVFAQMSDFATQAEKLRTAFQPAVGGKK